MKKMEMVCRICLELVTSSCSEPVEDVTKEVLKVLLIDVDLSLSEKPVICLRCKKRIEEFCDFKVMCIETEDLLQPYLRRNTNAEVDLERVYLDSLTPEEAVCGSEILKICRLCMKSKHCEYYSLSSEALAIFGIDETFLEKFLPEVRLSATKLPIICKSCLRMFVSFAKFIISWSRVEQKISGHCNMTRIGTKGRINIGKIARFIKNVTPGLIRSLDEVGTQGRTEKLAQPKEEIQSEEHLKSRNTAAEQPEGGNKRLGVGKQADTKRTLSVKTHEQTARHRHNRVSKKRAVGEKQGRTQTENPKGLSETAQRRLIVRVERLGDLKVARRNATREPKIEAKQFSSTGKKIYSCPECTLTSVYKHTVRRHFFRKHQLMSCADCPFTTNSKCKLKVHITKSHRLFRCSFCPATYTTFIGRRVHTNAKHAVVAKTYACKQCDFESMYQSNLNKHEQTHSGKRAVFRCDSCSYSSNFSNNVRRHALSHLDGSQVKLFKCYQCAYDTRWKGDLTNHIKYIHLEATDILQCPECPFKTKYKAVLALHSGKHDNIVYRCDKCIFRTVNKESWKKHCRVNEHS